MPPGDLRFKKASKNLWCSGHRHHRLMLIKAAPAIKPVPVAKPIERIQERVVVLGAPAGRAEAPQIHSIKRAHDWPAEEACRCVDRNPHILPVAMDVEADVRSMAGACE